jgi:hypothetical protein
MYFKKAMQQHVEKSVNLQMMRRIFAEGVSAVFLPPLKRHLL